MIANIVRDDKKHPEPYQASDFIVDWDEVWDAVSGRDEIEDEMDQQARDEAIASKVTWIHTWLGGVSE